MGHDPRGHLEQRERYLSAVVEIERRLLEADHDADVYALVLPVLLEVTQASRVYVVENRTDEAGRLLFTAVAEVVATGVPPVIGAPEAEDVAWDAVSPRWREILESGAPINGTVSGFPASERAYLEPQGVLSLLALPLVVDHDFFGLVGFDDCFDPRPWGQPEVALLQAATASLSAAIEWARATRALLESEQRQRSHARMMRLMCDTVPDLIWAKDMDRRFLFTNVATCEKLLHAADTDEPVGKTDMDFAERARAERPDRDDWHTFGELCVDSDSEIMESGTAQRFDEFGNVAGECLFLDVFKAPMFDDHGRMLGTVGCGRDVTEERLALERLATLEAGKTATLNATPDIHLRITRDGRFLEALAADPSILLLPSEQIVGRTLREILPPHVAEPAMDAVELAVAGGTASFEYALEVAGEGRHYEARVVPCGNDVLAVVRDITELQRNRDELAATAERLRVTLLDTVRAMGAMVQLRDPYTAGHERRVAALAEAVAGVLGLDEDRRRTVLVAGEIHDIGKIGVPAETLSKPRRLSPDERRLVEEHPERGYEILAGIHFDAPVAEIVRQHHERLDGSGYPRGLRGDEILPEARILAAADVLEAMSSHRPYRPALGVDAGLAELRAGAGVLFDERVVAACEEAVARGLVDLSESSAASWSLQM